MVRVVFGRKTAQQKVMSALAAALIIAGMLTFAFADQVQESCLLGNDGKNVGVNIDQSLKNSQTHDQNETECLLDAGVGTTDDSVVAEGGVLGLVVGLDGSGSAAFLELQRIAGLYQGKIVDTVSTSKQITAVVVEIPRKAVSAFTQEVRANSFRYVEPRMKFDVQFVPDDPYWNVQWGLQRIQGDWAWNTTIGSHGIIVAVLDTGIDWHHPDLIGNYAALGYDWVDGDADPMDDSGHGTHCAGIIAAALNNSVGISGIAQVRIMAEKVLNSQGEGYSDWIADGIIHAVEQGARIISMSFGDYEDSEVTYDAVKYAYDAGVLMIAAAGNDNTALRFYPAAYDEVVAVTATDFNDSKASFSNYGEWVELAAPGVDVVSTFLNNQYVNKSGTSMACPFVSGAAALVLSAYPNLTADFVRLLLRHTTDDLGQPNFDIYYGYGRIDARNALKSPSVEHELIAFRLTTPPYLKLGATNSLTAEVFNFGTAGETDVLIQLFAYSTLVWSYTVDFLTSYGSITVNIEWKPVVAGLFNLTLHVVPSLGEENVDNNYLTKFIYAGSPVRAVVIHSPDDVEQQIFENWAVLNNQWQLFGTQMVYVDFVSLNKRNITYQEIASTEADVLIICSASEREFKNSEIDAIERYVREGHGLIMTGDSFNEDVPNNKKLARLVGLDPSLRFRSYLSGTDLLQVLNLTHPIFHEVPNPIVFPSVSTFVPFKGRWDLTALAGGQYLALGYLNESAVIEFKGLFYISLLLEAIPPQYHHHLQLLYNAILSSKYEKPSHELKVTLDCPRYLKPMEQILLNATVFNMGRENEYNVQLYLLVDGETVNATTIPQLPSGSSRSVSYLWSASREGTHSISAFAPTVTGEDQTVDNTASKVVSCHFERVVLWDNTHSRSSDLRLKDYLSVRELLESEGFMIDELDHSAIDYETLAGYDILVLPASKTEFSSSEVTDILDWLAQGGSVLIIVDTGFDQSLRLLTIPYGVQIYRDNLPSQGTTSNVISHPITDGVTSIYYGSPERLEVKSPSQLLAWATSGLHEFNFLTATEAKEMVIVSDTHIMDNKGISRADNEQLTLNIFHWLALKQFREHDTGTILRTPTFAQRGEEVLLNATIRNLGANDEVHVQAQMLINNAAAESFTIPSLLSGETYTLSHLWIPLENGEYNVTVSVIPVSGEDFLVNNFMSREVSVFFYERYYFPDRFPQIGEPMGWHSDNGSWNCTLPFDFPFYNGLYKTIYVSSNGLVTFLGPDQSHSNLIDDLGGKLAVAPAWHDWTTQEPSDIYIGQIDSEHVFIGWDVCDSLGVAAKFAAELGKDGVIQFFYGYSNMTATVIIGISNGAGHMLAEYTATVNRIHTVVFAPFRLEHEVATSVEAPSTLPLDASVTLNATVFNLGLVNETSVDLILLVNGSIVNSTVVPELNVGSFYRISWLWTPKQQGKYNVTAYASPVSEEVYTDNNIDAKVVYVLTDTTTHISSDPKTIDVAVGGFFTLDIIVNNVDNLHAWQIKLYYNSTVFQCLDAWVAADNVFAGKNPILPEPLIEENYVMMGATLTGGAAFAGTGTLCKISFRADRIGNSTLMWDRNDTFLVDPGLKFINCTLIDGFAEAIFPDLDHDGKVATSDLIIIAQAFDSCAGDERWNSLCDLNHDFKINILDVAIMAKAFGKSA